MFKQVINIIGCISIISSFNHLISETIDSRNFILKYMTFSVRAIPCVIKLRKTIDSRTIDYLESTACTMLDANSYCFNACGDAICTTKVKLNSFEMKLKCQRICNAKCIPLLCNLTLSVTGKIRCLF